MKVLCLFFLGSFACAYAGSLPPYFTPCSKSDPQLSECIQKVISIGGSKFTEGIPSLGIAPLDPVELGTVFVDSPALKITFTDTVVTGLKGFRVNSYKMTSFSANLNIVVKYDFDESNGHWVVTSYKDHYKMDRAQFKFNNLFNGNKELAQTTERFTNENWEIIMNEIAPSALKQIIKKCIDVVSKFFAAAPVSELLLP